MQFLGYNVWERWGKEWMFGVVGKAVDVRRVTAVYESGGCTESDSCLRKRWMYGERTTGWETNICSQNSHPVYETNVCPQNSHLFTKQTPVRRTATLFTKQTPVHKTATCLRNKRLFTKQPPCLRNKCLSTEQPLHKTNPQKKRRKK